MIKFKRFLIILIFFAISINCTRRHKIIIIGAGPSGIAAASKLLENGVNDVLILEAESRIGGRINTVNFDGRNVDLGAEWVHGEKGNIVFETLKEKNLLDLIEQDKFAEKFHISSRENISKELSQELLGTLEEFYFEASSTNSRESLGQAFERRYTNYVTLKYRYDDYKLRIAKLTLDFLRHVILSLEGSFSWYDPSTVSDFEENEGYFNWGWKNNGYRKFLEILIKIHPNPREQLLIFSKVRINKEVVNINFEDDDVTVACSDGSLYTAKHVVFTPSLGVLKAKAKTLFVPQLPTNKMEAIERIGIGAVMKVFLKYEKKWWGNVPGFNFIWTNADRLSSKQKFPLGPSNSKKESWIVEIYTATAMSNSNILLVFLTGELIPVMEQMDNKTLIEGLEYTFDKFLGHLFDIPRIEKILRSNWYSNPNFQGTYSFDSMRSSGEDRINLMEPVTRINGDPVLQFAGEATHTIYQGTVHGAVESGYREANRLIELYKT